MGKVYIGIDNGTTASIGVLGLPGGPRWFTPPTKVEQNYHKKASNISRIHYPRMFALISGILQEATMAGGENMEILAVLEKPFTGMAHTAVLAGRCYEAEIIALEENGVPYTTICASDWQGTKKTPGLLPEGLKGSPQTKKASADVGSRLFPSLAEQIRKHKDADGLLIAEWARRRNL